MVAFLASRLLIACFIFSAQIIEEPQVMTDDNGTIIVTSGVGTQTGQGGAGGKQSKASRRSQTEAARGAMAEPNALRPATTKAGKARIRMKWSNDVNMFIMRTYYAITALESDTKAYRDTLHKLFNQQYPDVSISQQRIADQRRAIVKNNLLPTATLEAIKQEVAQSLQMKSYPQIKQEQPETHLVTTNGNTIPLKIQLGGGHHHHVITTTQPAHHIGHHQVITTSAASSSNTTTSLHHHQSPIIIRVNSANHGGAIKHHFVDESSGI